MTRWLQLAIVLGTALLPGCAASALDSLPYDSVAATVRVEQTPAISHARSRDESRSGLTVGDHVFLLVLGVVVGAAFGGAQKWAGYTIERNRRHHRAIAQLEYLLGRQFHLLTMNVARAGRLRDDLRAGRLGSTFPALHRPDDSPCIELFNVDLINAVLRVNRQLEVIDHNVDSLGTAYATVRDDFASNPTNEALRDAYERNAGPMADEYENLRQFMTEVSAQLERVLAWLRILGQRDRPGVWRFLQGQSRRSAKVTDKEMEEVVKEMKNERAAVGQETPRP